MKLCLTSMAPFVGGAEVALERLALGLQGAGHEVTVVLGKQEEVFERLVKAGLRCVYAPMYFTDKWHPLRYWRAKRNLRTLLRREKPEVIHSNDLPTHQIVSDAAQGLGVPRLCHHRFPFDGACIDWLNKFGAERHLFVSQALMEEMIGQSARLRMSSRVVVYDGLPLPVLPPHEEKPQRKQNLGLIPDRLAILFAGQIIERKGVAELLRAWAELAPLWSGRAQVVIVGDDIQNHGAYRQEMEKLATDLGCPVRFVGFQQQVADWLDAADIAVVPSHVEPLGNATLEAMAHALPVIGCDVGGIPEMIAEGETGLLVPPKQPSPLAAALADLLTDAERRKAMGQAGRQRCERLFSLEAHTQAVLREYATVLAEQKALSA